MKSISALALLSFVASSLAQTTVTEYVTIAPSSTQNVGPTSTDSVQTQAAISTPASTTFATSLSSSSSSIASSTLAAAASASVVPYDGGSPGAGSAVDTNAGASGSDDGSSFSLSQGGMIAIIVVVVLVAIFGIASTILFVVAKRRQWNVRASIARASRRLTGRFGGDSGRNGGASNRRTTVQGGRFGGPATPGPRGGRPSDTKRGFVAETRSLDRDLEKGPLHNKAPKSTRPREVTWIQKLWGNDWK